MRVTSPANQSKLAMVSSAVEIPQQDEVLKTLVGRFKDAPSSEAFVELASALLARGHAAEALSVADHGLMLVPTHIDGRVQRAAALLALGRPRVAYVELQRALAIAPGHRRTMRLLGRAFVDAGAPGRAAELLARRSAEPNPTDGPSQDLIIKSPSETDRTELPAMFSDLTRDLGLGAVIPGATLQVEVTQIMRRRRLPRPPRSKSELETFDGPIVDTTQPQPVDRSGDLDASGPERDTDPKIEGADLGFAMDDEPLFQEHLPFDVRPVPSESSSTTQPRLPRSAEAPEGRRIPHPRDPTLPLTKPRPSAARTASPTRVRPAYPEAKLAKEPPPLEVVNAPRKGTRYLLAILATVFMALYLAILGYLSAEELRVWFSSLPLPW